jgi:hypothetical protein
MRFTQRRAALFDTRKAIETAWNVLWASNIANRKKWTKEGYTYGLSGTYYLTASDVENQVRAYAHDEVHGKPWRTDRAPYGGWSVRVEGDLFAAVRDWLLSNPNLTYHNSGRGHVSGARFRPVGEPLAPAEVRSAEKREKERTDPRPRVVHFGSYSLNGLLCTIEKRSPFSRTRNCGQREVEKVTCPRCKSLLANPRARGPKAAAFVERILKKQEEVV